MRLDELSEAVSMEKRKDPVTKQWVLPVLGW